MTTDPKTILEAAAPAAALHDCLLATPAWPATITTAAAAGTGTGDDFRHWVQTNYRCNSLLWAEEDLARRTVEAEAIIADKRAIDGHNQAHNDVTERIDELLLVCLGLVDAATAATDAPVFTAPPGAQFNSDTAGSMVDPLGILALKVHAMRQQCARTDADAAHIAASQGNLRVGKLRAVAGAHGH